MVYLSRLRAAKRTVAWRPMRSRRHSFVARLIKTVAKRNGLTVAHRSKVDYQGTFGMRRVLLVRFSGDPLSRLDLASYSIAKRLSAPAVQLAGKDERRRTAERLLTAASELLDDAIVVVHRLWAKPVRPTAASSNWVTEQPVGNRPSFGRLRSSQEGCCSPLATSPVANALHALSLRTPRRKCDRLDGPSVGLAAADSQMRPIVFCSARSRQFG